MVFLIKEPFQSDKKPEDEKTDAKDKRRVSPKKKVTEVLKGLESDPEIDGYESQPSSPVKQKHDKRTKIKGNSAKKPAKRSLKTRNFVQLKRNANRRSSYRKTPHPNGM